MFCFYLQWIILVILSMAEILHQLIGSLSHFYRVLYIPGGVGFLPSTVGGRDHITPKRRQGLYLVHKR